MKKTECIYCHEPINKPIEKSFEQFECGKIICPHCHKEQKRYLSEADLLIYFGFTAVLYSILITLIFSIYQFFGVNWASLLLIVFLFILGYFIIKTISNLIYQKAYFKEDIKDKVIHEEVEIVQKRMKWQFIMFMLVGLMMSYQADLFLPFMFLIIAFIVIIIIKIKLAIKNERQQ